MALLNSCTKLYKITNEKEIHIGFQYHNGLNIDHNQFNYSGSCVSGGLYFTTAEHISDFFEYGCWLREVKLPFDNPKIKYVQDPDCNKWRANMIILETRYPLFTVSTLRMLYKENNEFDKLWINHFKHVKYSLQYLYKMWKSVYKLDDKKEVYLLALLMIIKNVENCEYRNFFGIANNYCRELDEIYTGKYSDIIDNQDLLTVINHCSARGTRDLIERVIDKIFNGNDYILAINQLNFKNVKTVTHQYPLNKSVVRWCFEKYSPTQITDLYVQHFGNISYQQKLDLDTVKQIILGIKQKSYNNDIN